ncbi:MAG: hypothetical protein AAF389_14250 [Gemmatimonadota bacterium]
MAEGKLSGRATEALTIIVSILLALGADAAWDIQRDRADEAELLAGITSEFDAAVQELRVDSLARDAMHRRYQLALAHRRGDVASPDSLVAIFGSLLDWRFHTPGHAVLDDALTSGRFQLIRSDSVRTAIMRYQRQRERLDVFEVAEREIVENQLEPYLASHLALDRLLRPADPAEVARFGALLRDDDTFGSLLMLKRQRTRMARTFAGMAASRAEDVVRALTTEG